MYHRLIHKLSFLEVEWALLTILSNKNIFKCFSNLFLYRHLYWIVFSHMSKSEIVRFGNLTGHGKVLQNALGNLLL